MPELACAECGRGECDVPRRFVAFRAVDADQITSLDEVETFCVVVMCRPCAEREGLVHPAVG